MEIMKRTALYDQHVALNAKLVPFAGYIMPVQYGGIIQEHLTVRSAAGLFDVSHMGEFIVNGPKAEKFLQYVTLNDVTALQQGQAQYSAMCYDNGGIIDDLLIYRFADYFMVVVNASNIDNDYQWMEKHLINGASLENHSEKISLIAIQGPQARAILNQIASHPLDDLPFYHFRNGALAGKAVTIARTGYTGELGFEIYGKNDDMPLIWTELLQKGAEYGLVPVGLGARDTLRLEMKYCLYGNDIDETTNPIEAGLGWITKLEKGDFIGKVAIQEKKANWSRRLVCLEMQERAVPRPDYKVYVDDSEIGYITSGTQSPVLKKGIGLAYLNRGFTKSGNEVMVAIRGQFKKALVVKPPFYKDGTAQD